QRPEEGEVWHGVASRIGLYLPGFTSWAWVHAVTLRDARPSCSAGPARPETRRRAGPEARRSRNRSGRREDHAPPIELPTELNLLEAFLPSVVTAAMHTTAMRATRSAYSTSDAPRSLLM